MLDRYVEKRLWPVVQNDETVSTLLILSKFYPTSLCLFVDRLLEARTRIDAVGQGSVVELVAESSSFTSQSTQPRRDIPFPFDTIPLEDDTQRVPKQV